MIHLTRRASLAAALAPFAASAQTAPWSPARPIRLIAPYPPGGGVDTTSRLLGGPIGTFLGQPVVVENRAGAGGSLGAAELARSAPDGQTIMIDALAHTVNPHLIRGLSFDYANAFTPISQVVVLPQILVVPTTLPVRTVTEFVTWLRANPGKPYGSSGNATAAHLAAVLFLERAGVEATHVPYRGGTAALPDLISGQTSFLFATVSSGLQLVREGRLRALAVTTTERIPPLPEVPALAETYPGYELNEWNGLYAPANLPAPIVARLYDAAKAALAAQHVQQRLEALGAMPVGSSPADFARYVRAQTELMGRIVREARIEIG